MGDLTAHFSLKEFACRDSTRTEVPLEYRGNVLVLAQQLEVIRQDLGCPITVVSGYRTAGHNAFIGGAKHSRHLTGEAADIKAKGRSATLLHAAILQLIHSGRLRDGGVGAYPGWVHYDIGRPRRW